MGKFGGTEEGDQMCSPSSNGEQMLSFSFTKSSPVTRSGSNPFALAASRSSSKTYSDRNADFNSEYLSVKMPRFVECRSEHFTLSQRKELEQQMLIYNYIQTNAPIPTNLISSLRRGMDLSGFSICATSSIGANAGLWGCFHAGFVGNSDSEPSRCRRTDGKKWRCSKDAVLEQKYCEKHLNRGRHRSRKHVESQGVHALKTIPVTTNSASATNFGSLSLNSLTVAGNHRHQLSTTDISSHICMPTNATAANSLLENAEGHSLLHATPCESLFLTSKNEGTCSLELDSGNALVSQQRASVLTNNSPVKPFELNDHQCKQLHIQEQFEEEWNPRLRHRTAIIWQDGEAKKFKKTQLAVAFPFASSDFSSSIASSVIEKETPIIGLGVLDAAKELNSMQIKWRATPWELRSGDLGSSGGPLGEALNTTNSTATVENTSSFSLINDEFELSPQLALPANTMMQSSKSAKDVEYDTNEGLNSLFCSM
ncbi:hypothetical protein HPP92_019049 [Vanilla planifolia]|uniref:Growth-regulating factor n=1 Tax=Vanilla planifolia TaxID=51239 RepID=A0A835Q270_VANPL|nr:hypothetical protein HPP92_019049 [Vanilla planifolia]